MIIDISGLDKADLLIALYNGSKQQGMGFLHEPTPLTKYEANDLLRQTSYFDYLRGRVMKVDLAGDTLDPWGYDRDLGEGAAARIVDNVRANK